MFIVKTSNPAGGDPFYLKGTTWSFSRERAQTFDTKAAAETQLEKSKRFNNPWAAKHAKIEEA